MTRKPKGPVKDAPARVRQRQRADGSWRVWWEPEPAVRKRGFVPVELDAATPMKAARKARELNDAVDQARITGKAPTTRRGPVCIEDVIEDYRSSVHFCEALAAKTRDSYSKGLRLIVEKWGDVPVADFTKPMARTWYESLYRDAGKWQAAALIRLLSIVMNHAELRGWRPENSNPCMRLGVSIPKGRDRVVDWSEYDALQAAALRCVLPSIGVAAALSYLAGQRETDVMLALRGDFAQRAVRWPGSDADATVWVWSLDRSKTGASGQILLHDELAPIVAAVLARPAPADARLLVEERLGRPYDEDLFQSRFGEVRAAAIAGGTGKDGTHAPCPSLATMQFRDLRRSFSVNARRNGASPADAGDALGNSAATNSRIKGTYMPAEFFTAARAVTAVARPKPDDERKKA
jgi:hypothetical protein